MDLRKLRSFLAVVDLGTVSRAAQVLHLAQPALSRQVHALERELKLKLFDMRRGRLQLTAAGGEFVPVARDLIAREDRAHAAAESLAHGEVSKLVVAAVPTTTRDLIAPFVASLDSTGPLILTRHAEHGDIPDELNAGADFVVSPVPVGKEYQVLPLQSVWIRALVANGHPWTERCRNGVRLDELVEERLIASGPHAVSRIALDSAVAAAGLSYREIHSCDDSSTTRALAASGKGVAVLTVPSAVSGSGIPILDAKGIPIERLSVHLTVAWHPDHYSAATISRLAEALRDFHSANEALN